MSAFSDDILSIMDRCGDKVFLIDARSQLTISFAQCADLLRRMGTFFAGYRMAPDSAVLSLLPNSVEQLIVFLAAGVHGHRFVPVAETTTSGQLRDILKLVDADLAILPAFPNRQLRAVLDEADIPSVQVPLDMRFGWVPLGTARAVGAAPQKAGGIAISTSGSTGGFRMLGYDIGTLWHGAKAFAAMHPFMSDDARFLNNLSMSYLGGLHNLCLIPLATGSSILVDEPYSGKSSFTLWHDVQRFEISVIWSPPPILSRLVNDVRLMGPKIHEEMHKHVRAFLIGMSPADFEDKVQFEETFKIPVLENYALSETGFISTETIENRRNRHAHSVGALLPGVETRLVPIADKEGVNEIWVKTPYMFEGYLTGGTATNSVESSGFLNTGDVGHIDEHGQLFLEGRVRDIVKRGDLLIYLREVEDIARSHDTVTDASAKLIKHKILGESYVLYCQLKPHQTNVKVETIRAWLHNLLPREKWPDELYLVDDLPRTSVGKIRKHALN